MVGKRPLELGVGKKITSLRRAFNSGEDIGRVKPRNIQIWNYNKIDKILGLQLYFSRNIYTYCFYDLNNHENVKIRSFIKLSIFQHICYSAPQSAPPQDKKAIKLSFFAGEETLSHRRSTRTWLDKRSSVTRAFRERYLQDFEEKRLFEVVN